MDKLIQGEMKYTAKRILRMMEKNKEKYDSTKKYADMFLSTIRPLRYFLIIQGQCPFAVKEFSTKPTAFIAKWTTNVNLIYLFCLIVGTFNFLSITAGYAGFFTPALYELKPTIAVILQEDINDLGKEIHVSKDWEKENIREHFSLLLVIYLWLVYLMMMNVTIFIRRKAFLNYLNYWLFSFQMMQMDIPESVFSKMLMEILFAVTVMMTLVIASFGNLVPIISSMLDIMSFLYLRHFHHFLDVPLPKEILDKDTSAMMYYAYKIPGAIIIAMAYVGARATAIHFVFYNRLLAGISKTWNQRMRDGLVQNEIAAGKLPKTTNVKIRIELRLLLDDHYNIVQLYKMTEDLFGYQLIVYYFLETISMIFELYYMASVYPAEQVIDSRYGEVGTEVRTQAIFKSRLSLELSQTEYNTATAQFFVALAFLFLTSVFVFITTDCCNAAYVEGMSGFQVLRRNCYLGSCDTTQERNFIHSLIVSYAPNNPIQISANGYFDINRSLVSNVMINVMGYLVAAYTLKPDTSEFWNYGRYANLCPNATCRT